jgi:hypothetical protein
MQRQGFVFELDGKKTMGFDTGLDSRAFARAKLTQLLTQPGFIVKPGNAEDPVELWKPSGVIEYSADGRQPTMVVCGPVFEGERLDLIVNDESRADDALQAIALWIRAALALDEESRNAAPLWPCAAIVSQTGESVFFAPPGLALRCLRAEEESLHFSGYEQYVHPDLGGTELVNDNDKEDSAVVAKNGNTRIKLGQESERAMRRTAFTAAAMLYRVLSGKPAFRTASDIVLHQDMRDGHFMPVRLAAPGLNGQLAGLIQKTLESESKKNSNVTANNFAAGSTAEKPSSQAILAAIHGKNKKELFTAVSEAEMQQLEKEKAGFLKVKTASVNARRFVVRNAGVLLGSIAAFAAVAFFVGTMAASRASRPTTAGMDPVTVIESYYNAFGDLDHMLMEGMLLRRKVAESDINMVVHLFVNNRVRMASELNSQPLIISARQWQEEGSGSTGSASVFGVTDLQIRQIDRSDIPAGGSAIPAKKGEQELFFRADYLLWAPAQMLGSAETDSPLPENMPTDSMEVPPPVSFSQTDFITMVQRQGNWRISGIVRTVN